MDFIDDDPTWPFTRAKTAVIRAAASVIRESGPRAATLKNIAQKAGITEPAIFRHFEGVDGLFKGLFFLFERLSAKITACFDRPEKGLARVLAATRSILDIFCRNKDFAYLILHAEHIFRGYDDLRKNLTEIRSADNSTALGALEEAREMGELRKDVLPKLAAVAIMGILFYTVQGWVENDGEFDIVTFAAGRVEALLGLFRNS